MRIVLCYPVEAIHLAQIRAAWPGCEIVDAGQERIAAELPQADIYCGHAKVPVPWDDVVAAGRLQWIQSSAAGMDHCLVPSVINSDIIVTSASGVLAKQVADHTMALLAGMLRDLPTYFRAKEKREFIRRPTRDLHGATIGIVGMGRIGLAVARRLHFGWGMKVLFTKRAAHPEAEMELGAKRVELDELLAQSDFVSVHADMNTSTKGMFGAAQCKKMKRTAVFVNTARGPLVDQTALAEALRSGTIFAAGLDVTEPEPLPQDHELYKLPNCIIVPHIASATVETRNAMARLCANNVLAGVKGDPLPTWVNPEVAGTRRSGK